MVTLEMPFLGPQGTVAKVNVYAYSGTGSSVDQHRTIDINAALCSDVRDGDDSNH